MVEKLQLAVGSQTPTSSKSTAYEDKKSPLATLSNINLNVLANVMPIALTLEKEPSTFASFKMSVTLQYWEQPGNPTELKILLDPWDAHPAIRQYILIFKSSPSGSNFNIYTETSLCNRTVGAAHVILDKGKNIIHKAMYKLQGCATIYAPEILAILKSLQRARTLTDRTSFNFFTDRLSTLQELARRHNNHPAIQALKTSF